MIDFLNDLFSDSFSKYFIYELPQNLKGHSTLNMTPDKAWLQLQSGNCSSSYVTQHRTLLWRLFKILPILSLRYIFEMCTSFFMRWIFKSCVPCRLDLTISFNLWWISMTVKRGCIKVAHGNSTTWLVGQCLVSSHLSKGKKTLQFNGFYLQSETAFTEFWSWLYKSAHIC